MKKLPIGIQSFRDIIEGGFVYVDKTQYVYNLLNESKHTFLSRPRRFGKSLFLDTLNEVFSGDKELFKGLFIYGSDYIFEKHPVLRLDMSNISNDTTDALRISLSFELHRQMQSEGLECLGASPSDMLKFMIEGLYRKYNKKTVVLIDEYDKPIIDHLDNLTVAESNRDFLRSFYGIIKSMDAYVRLSFITGVS